MHVEIRTGEDRLIGSFRERAVALWIARELLDVAPHVLLQTFDDDSRLVAEALMSRRAGSVEEAIADTRLRADVPRLPTR